MFTTLIKQFQLQHNSQTWQQTLRNREVIRNSYRASGDIKKAKAFVNQVAHYSFEPITERSDEQLIFSLEMALAPAYSM